MNCIEPVPSGSSTPPNVVASNQAAPGLRWHCPRSSHEVAEANPRTSQYRREPPDQASRESHPSPRRRLNGADKRPKEGHG